jgi:hypothetical protein
LKGSSTKRPSDSATQTVTRSEREPDLEQTTKTVIELWSRAMSGES